jgi:hypothetical protein
MPIDDSLVNELHYLYLQAWNQTFGRLQKESLGELPANFSLLSAAEKDVPGGIQACAKTRGIKVRRNMKAKWVLGSLFAASVLTSSAFGQVSIGVTIGTPPPPIRYEVPPPMPAVGYEWVAGYWAPVGGRYVWYPGRWHHPPYYGAAWRPARWVHEGHGYRYYEGGWGPREFHGPPPGHAYGHYKDRDHGHGHGHGHDD